MNQKMVRDSDVTSDPMLGADEKELRMVCPNGTDHCIVSTEIPTFIKWLQSIPASEFTDVKREDGEIVQATAKVPKGNIKLQATARKSDTHSQMVSYGNLRDK